MFNRYAVAHCVSIWQILKDPSRHDVWQQKRLKIDDIGTSNYKIIHNESWFIYAFNGACVQSKWCIITMMGLSGLVSILIEVSELGIGKLLK